MKFLLHNSGWILVLIGALVLTVPFFVPLLQSNTSLLTGWILIVVGFVAYILGNKKR
jgi:nicotinamide riboside transporter PnuC